MARFLAGVASALLLTTAGLFWWRSSSAAEIAPIPVAQAAAVAQASLSEPPVATEKTREEKRFSRYDRDKDGAVRASCERRISRAERDFLFCCTAMTISS